MARDGNSGPIQIASSARCGQALYLLSTSAQELIHSNMLCWLFRHCPEQSAPLMEALGWPGDPKPRVQREFHHFDPYLSDPAGCALVIENKLTAIPDQGQLAIIGSHVV